MNHYHTSTYGVTYTISGATVPNCKMCAENTLLSRLSRFIHAYDPYQPHRVDPWRLADLLEGKDGPDDDYCPARNERVWSMLNDRISSRVLWSVNWAFGINVWGERDWGVFEIDFGPFRFHTYARWGLTEGQRTHKWLKHA